jgi:hypothetical protein
LCSGRCTCLHNNFERNRCCASINAQFLDRLPNPFAVSRLYCATRAGCTGSGFSYVRSAGTTSRRSSCARKFLSDLCSGAHNHKGNICHQGLAPRSSAEEFRRVSKSRRHSRAAARRVRNLIVMKCTQPRRTKLNSRRAQVNRNSRFRIKNKESVATRSHKPRLRPKRSQPERLKTLPI